MLSVKINVLSVVDFPYPYLEVYIPMRSQKPHSANYANQGSRTEDKYLSSDSNPIARHRDPHGTQDPFAFYDAREERYMIHFLCPHPVIKLSIHEDQKKGCLRDTTTQHCSQDSYPNIVTLKFLDVTFKSKLDPHVFHYSLPNIPKQ